MVRSLVKWPHWKGSLIKRWSVSLYTGSSDYIEIFPSENPLVDFLTETGTASQCFMVQVREDVIVEDLEEFNLVLSISGNDSVLLNSVTVSPDVLVVRIEDNDGMWEGQCYIHK